MGDRASTDLAVISNLDFESAVRRLLGGRARVDLPCVSQLPGALFFLRLLPRSELSALLACRFWGYRGRRRSIPARLWPKVVQLAYTYHEDGRWQADSCSHHQACRSYMDITYPSSASVCLQLYLCLLSVF